MIYDFRFCVNFVYYLFYFDIICMKHNITTKKSYDFSLLTIELYKELIKLKEFDIARQILRSGTSIGANLQEAQGAQSHRDFIHKISISYKESRETLYWLHLIQDSEIYAQSIVAKMIFKNNELNKILSSILITLKTNKPYKKGPPHKSK